MPAVRAATMRAEDLPAVATAAELAEFERVDTRTLRADLEAGKVPGAYRRGRSWRIVTATYLDALSRNSRLNSTNDDESPSVIPARSIQRPRISDTQEPR